MSLLTAATEKTRVNRKAHIPRTSVSQMDAIANLKGWRSPCFLGAIIATALNGCADQVDALIVIRLRVSVVSTLDQPIQQVSIWLRDRHFKQAAQPKILRKPVCVTDEEGECHVIVRYGYGYTSWPWTHMIEERPGLSERFELAVANKEGRLLGSRVLRPLVAAQIQGANEIRARIRLTD